MKALIFVLLVVAVICAYVYYDFSPAEAPQPVLINELEDTTESQKPPTVAPAQIAVFENSDYNFSFKYRIKPYGYSVFENSEEQNSEIGALFGTTFVRSTDYNDSVKAASEGNAHDGPPVMSVYVFSASKVLDLKSWLVGNKMITNCSEAEILATTLAGKDAMSCLWDGLYLGVTVALMHDNKIYVLTGTREEGETNDGFSYKKDFDDMVTSFVVSS